jgi:hygromycin-B 4-O-kinase
MAQIKPVIEERDVLTLLSEHFGTPVTRLASPRTGQIARTYFFAVDDGDYVLRFNRDTMGAANFPKEAYVHATYASPRIPIPEILHVGRLGDLHYAISRRVPGEPLVALPYPEYRALIPAFLDTLDAIHGVEVVDGRGYGTFGDDGAGPFASWRESLAAIREEEEPRGFYGKWHHLFADSFLERDLFDKVYGRMTELLEHCPAERRLVHGGYDLSNVVGHEGRITGVLDWVDARYGDFLYDVAGLDFWTPGEGYAERCKSRYAAGVGVPPAYEERLLCYQCHHALDALRFNARTGDRDGYAWVRNRIADLIGRGLVEARTDSA